MSGHLTDFDILLLANESAKGITRELQIGHLADCELCREKLIGSYRELQEESGADAGLSAGRLGAGTAAHEKAILEEIAAAHPRMGAGLSDPKTIPLYVEADPSVKDEFPLAASSPDSPVAPLPVLRSADGRLVVRFRHPAEKEPIRAHVIGDLAGTGDEIELVFPKRDLAFTVDRKGRVDLPGIASDDLADGRVQIVLQPGGPNEED